ncbi:MAG: prepilin-type N-terminal cleavage/methylation domain-containing protein, partial [Puniceicoccales bacterium]|nr:prepilin-type N-terminal cleavage/methylation domain-containing protein [Puniceicoccales bacterium]
TQRNATQRNATQRNATQRNATQKLKAFTLIEVIFVFAIIAILLAILLPGMIALKRNAQRVQDASHLKKIAEGWKIYTIDLNLRIPVWPRAGLPGGHEFVPHLSGGSANNGWKGRERCIINDPYVYVAPGDKYASKVKKTAVVISAPSGGDAAAYLSPYITSRNEIANDTNSVSFSYCLISGLSSSVPLDTTPIAFTRGLKANGKWHSKYGLYGDKGGYVAYGDGHIVWFDGSKPAKFLKWDKTGYSTDIRNALPNNTFISSGWNMNTNIKDTDGSLLIIYHAGTGGTGGN